MGSTQSTWERRAIRMNMNTLLGLVAVTCLCLVVRAKVVVEQEEMSECGTGWIDDGSNCFFLLRYYEYFQSRLECQEMCIWARGGQLASIHSQAEQDLIMKLIQDSGVLDQPTQQNPTEVAVCSSMLKVPGGLRTVPRRLQIGTVSVKKPCDMISNSPLSYSSHS